MFDNIRLYIDFDKLRQAVSEEQLYRLFAKQYPKTPISSPFRIDKHPSFTYYKSNGKIHWFDQATGEGGDIYDYLLKADSRLRSFQDVLSFINDQLQLGLGEPAAWAYIRTTSPQKRIAAPTDKVSRFMQVIRKFYTKAEYDIWRQWAITPEILKFYNTYSASQVWLQKEEELKLIWTRTDTNPIFCFHFPETKHVKCYRPQEEDRKQKFIGNANGDDVQGYEQCNIELRRPKLLILTKAQKENMFYRSFGLDAMASQGEGHHLNSDFIRHLKKYCGQIILFYDNDAAGIHAARNLREEYDLPCFFIPKQFGAKNITDLFEINKKQAYSIIQYLSEWNSYRGHLTSYRNILKVCSSIEKVDYTGDVQYIHTERE
jgi:5S rRNA maturation endonuclease (ribonuclease M5)